MKKLNRIERAKMLRDKIRNLSDGVMKSREIAQELGVTAKYVQNVWKRWPDIPRPKWAPPSGVCNPSFVSGRKIDRDGYVLVSAPPNHPYARKRKDRDFGIIYEHRHIMEKHLGRYLEPGEVVHHINACTLDNRIENLELCDSNAEHLKMEQTGKPKNMSLDGRAKLRLSYKERAAAPRVCNYSKLRKQGEIRLRQILRAHELHGTDRRVLSGTLYHLKKSLVSGLCGQRRDKIEKIVKELQEKNIR